MALGPAWFAAAVGVLTTNAAAAPSRETAILATASASSPSPSPPPDPPAPPASPPTGWAHIFKGDIRMDQCLPGMPANASVVSNIIKGAPAQNNAQAQHLLRKWVHAARHARSECYTNEGMPPVIREDIGTISSRYKLNFQTAAKVASQTAEGWMKCRFDAGPGQKAEPDFTRFMFVRNPGGRAISGFYQLVAHLLELIKLPPDLLLSCQAMWAGIKGVDGKEPGDLLAATNLAITEVGGECSFPGSRPAPAACKEAWSFMLPAGTEDPKTLPKICTAVGMNLNSTVSTANSALLKALWELPARCRLPGNETDGSLNGTYAEIAAEHHLPQWMCTGDQCDKACKLSDEKLAQLFSHALSDIAKTHSIGCDGQIYAGEHLWSQETHLQGVGRADVVIRLESLEEDVARFEKWLGEKMGHELPPPKEGCTLEELKVNEGTNKELPSGMFDPDRLKEIMGRSDDLQKRVCALFYHDFVCAGYELLDACKDAPVSSWLGDAMHAMLTDAPVAPLQDRVRALEVGSLML